MIDERDEREEWHRALNRELEAQAERLAIRKVIARRDDGVDEMMNIIQVLTDNGITVYVEAPRPNGEALALLRELNDALVIPGWLQPRVDAVLDGCELEVMPIFATLIIHQGVAHVTSPNVGKLPDGEYPLSVHQKYHTATDVERGITEWRTKHDKSKPQREKP